MLGSMSRSADGAPVRRAQADRSRASRDRILDAAVECLEKDGYARTNTLNIQARAGFSRGRLLHQFRSKDELLVAAAHHVSGRRLGEARAIATSLPSAADDPGARLDAVVTLIWHTFHRAYFWAASELWMAARTAPDLAEVILPAERRLGAAIRDALDTLYGPELSAHPMFPTVRDVLFSSMRGVALTYTFDRRDPATEPALRGWQQLARAVLLAPPGTVGTPPATPGLPAGSTDVTPSSRKGSE
jgi:AcrR family transcriptional regulator